MSVISFIWAVIILLKLFTDLVTVGWFIVLLWPLIPVLAFIALAAVIAFFRLR